MPYSNKWGVETTATPGSQKMFTPGWAKTGSLMYNPASALSSQMTNRYEEMRQQRAQRQAQEQAERQAQEQAQREQEQRQQAMQNQQMQMAQMQQFAAQMPNLQQFGQMPMLQPQMPMLQTQMPMQTPIQQPQIGGENPMEMTGTFGSMQTPNYYGTNFQPPQLNFGNMGGFIF